MEHHEHTYTPIQMTPELAQYILINEMYERQRPNIPIAIEKYARQMQAKLWRSRSIITFVVYRGKRHLVNGKQRLTAIVLSGVTIPLTIEEIPVDTEEEMDEWYTIYDQHDRRSLSVRLNALNLPDILQLNKSQTRYLSACLPLMASGFAPVPGGMRMYTEDIAIRRAFLLEWNDEAHIFYPLIKGAPQAITSNLRRAGVMPVFLVLLRFTGTDGEEFLQHVAIPDHLAVNDPRHRLHIFLRTSDVRTEPWHVLSRYVAVAWNAFYKEQTPNSLQPGNSTAPLRLEGTPHTGKAVLRYITPTGEVLREPQPYDPETWRQGMFHATEAEDL